MAEAGRARGGDGTADSSSGKGDPDAAVTGDILSFGDTVMFFNEHDQDNNVVENQGYLYNENPLNPILHIRTANQHDPDLPNLKGAAFQVLPALKYKMSKRYAKRKAQIEKFLAKEQKKKPNDDAAMSADEASELKLLEAAVEAEKQDNITEQERMRQKPVTYGLVVQLLHNMTNMFLHVSTEDAAYVDVQGMRIGVRSNSSKHTWFKIMPRYKVRSEGDYVRMGDQIILESVKTPGQFIHVSKKLESLGDDYSAETKVLCSYPEVDLSVLRDAFTVRPHILSAKKSEASFLRGGDTIALLHKELDSYVAAEGNFVDVGVPGVCIGEDIHMRARSINKRREDGDELNTDSALTYWQVELAGHGSRGAIILWEQPIRFFHLLTRKYLSFKKGSDGKICPQLVESTAEKELTYFKLYPVVKEGIEVMSKSFCRIEHIASKLWIHGTQEEYKHKQYAHMTKKDPKNKVQEVGIEDLHWDNASLKQVASFEFRYDDAFAIIPIHDQRIQDFNYVAGLLPVVHEFYMFYKNKPVTADYGLKMVVSLRDTLKALINWVESASEHPTLYKLKKSRQKLLRQTRLIDICVLLLKMPFKISGGFKISDVGFNKAGVELADVEKLPRIQLVCTTVYMLLSKYLEGNSKKNELYVAKYIPFFQYQLSSTSFGVAQMLMQLVKDNGKILDRIEPPQIDSFVHLLQTTKDSNFMEFLDVLCTCKGHAITKSQTYVASRLLDAHAKTPLLYHFKMEGKVPLIKGIDSPSSAYVPFEDFLKQAKANDGMAYVERQVGLCAQLCVGRNEINQKIVSEILPYEVAFWGASSSVATNKIRTAFVRVLRCAYVDVADNYPFLENIKLSVSWNDLDSPMHDITEPTKSLTGQKMPHFLELRDFIYNYIKDNQVVIAKEEQKNILSMEVLILASTIISFGYYTQRADIDKLLEVLLGYLSGHNDMMIPNQEEKNLLAWKKSDRFKKNKGNKMMAFAKYEGFSIIQLLINYRTNLRMHEFISDFKKILSFKSSSSAGAHSLSHFASIFTSAAAVSSPDHILQSISEALNANVPSGPVLAYLHVLFERTDFIKRDRVVPILLDLARYDYTKLTIGALDLVDQLYSDSYSLFSNTFKFRILVTDESHSMYNKIQDELTELRALANLMQWEPAQEKTMSRILTFFKDICRLEGAITEPHEINVMMLYQCEIINDLLDILNIDVDLELGDREVGMIAVKSDAYKLIATICRKNTEIQADLFEHLDMLIDVKGTADMQGEKGLALNEIFKDNQVLSIKVKASHVNKIVNLVAEWHRWEFLQLLNTLAKIDLLDLPIRRNQNLVIKYMMQQRNETVLLVNDDQNEERIKLMENGTAKTLNVEDALAYKYHIRLVRMLATCCEGDNRFVESMCQNIFSPEEIYEVLLDEKIDMNSRRPYLRFFLWAWLNSDVSLDSTRIEEIQYDKEIWQFFTLLCKFTNVFMKKDLTKIMDDEPGQQEVITVFEAYMPFLESFFTNYFTENDRLAREHPNYKDGISQLVDTCIALLEAIIAVPTFGTKKRQTDVKDVFLVWIDKGLLTAEQTEKYNILLEKMLKQHDHKAKENKKKKTAGNVVTTRKIKLSAKANSSLVPVQEYNKVFGKELSVNESLFAFCEHLEKAYIDNPNTPNYDEFDLPKGLEFQEHLKLFVNLKPHHHSKTGFAYDSISPYADIIVLGLEVAVKVSVEEDEKDMLDRLNNKHLSLLRAIIVTELMNKPEEIHGHESEFHRVDDAVKEIQDTLNKLKVPLKVLPFMSSEDEHTARCSLRLIINLLDGGNHSVQDSLYDYFLSNRNESFFIDVQTHLIDSAGVIKEIRSLMQAQLKEQAARKALVDKTVRSATLRGSSGANGSVPNEDALIDGGGKKSMMEMSSFNLLEEDLKNDEEESNGPPVEFTAVAGLSKELLRILQLLCEGQNQKMKNYISKQPDNIKSVNLVQKAVEYLQVIYLNVDMDSAPLVIQNLNTLVEVTIGNRCNQGVIFDAKIVDIINHLIRQPNYGDCTAEIVADVKESAVLLASTLLEENGVEAARLAKDLFVVLDLDAIRKVLFDKQYTLSGPESGVGFNCYKILCRFRDFNPLESENIEEELGLQIDERKDREKYEMIKEYREGTEHIEIWHDNELQKVYFPIGRMRKNLRDELKDEILWSVDRSTPQDKIRDFLDRGDDFLDKMKYQDILVERPILKLLILELDQYIYWFMLLLTLIINIVMLSSWTSDQSFDNTYPIVPPWYNVFLYITGSVHIFTSVVIAVTFYIANPPTQWNPLKEKCSWLQLDFWYYLIFVAFSFAGIFTQGYFYGFHLLHVIVNNNLLVRVLQSVTKNGRALLMVAMLMVIIMYQYSLILFAYYRDEMNPSQNPIQLCDDFFECFVTSLNTGLRAGGGIGDTLSGNGNTTWSYIGVRALLDISYFIVITTIALNIVFGIIVDTFSELRDEKFQIEDDMKSRCFICSLSADEFDREGGGFGPHIEKDHNMWSYLFFLNYLSEKDSDDYTAHEQYVADNKDDVCWLPINRALALQADNDEIQDQLREIREQLNTLLDRFKAEDMRRVENEQRVHQRNLLASTI